MNDIQVVKIVPKLAKHKEKVRKWGSVWRVIEYRHFVHCLNESGVLVCPCDSKPANILHPQSFWVSTQYIINEGEMVYAPQKPADPEAEVACQAGPC